MAARACAQWPAPIALSALLGADGFAPLTDPLLIALLVSTPNSDSALERLFTLLRGAMLRERPQGDDPLAFAAALNADVHAARGMHGDRWGHGRFLGFDA